MGADLVFELFRVDTFCSGEPFYRATAKHTHGIVIDILSVRPFVCLSNVCIVTKRDNRLSIFQHRTIEQCF